MECRVRYTLEVIEGNVTTQEFYEFVAGKYGKGIESYIYTENMIKHSKQFPNAVFCLNGVSEDSEGNVNRWKEYYKDGKFQYSPVKMTFEPYDENKLETID